MESNEEKLLRLEFYQEILLAILDNSHPFYALIVYHQLSKQDVEEIYLLCEKINKEYKKQKEEGFVTFLPLLTHFVGMLNYKLDPYQTINALYKQNIYRDLMKEFQSLVTKIN
jgi:hypothetical protein